MREAITELPKEIRWRKDKKGFIIPEETWYKNELKGQILTLIKNSVLNELGIINKKSFLEYFNNFLNGNRNIHYSDISKVFIAEKWAANFIS